MLYFLVHKAISSSNQHVNYDYRILSKFICPNLTKVPSNHLEI